MPTGWSVTKTITRKCNVCGVVKRADELVASKRYRDGYMPCCKVCRNEYWRHRRMQSPETRAAHGDAVRRSRLLSDYGITQADYERMLKEQQGKCKLCGSKEHGRSERFRYWNVDHSHVSGTVRGLLCHTCNISIGKLEALAQRIGLDTIMEYIKE